MLAQVRPVPSPTHPAQAADRRVLGASRVASPTTPLARPADSRGRSRQRNAPPAAAADNFRIISLNVNGIRSAARKGVFPWLAAQHADVICVQELKAQEADMTAALLADATRSFDHRGWFHHAEKRGYSGAGLYARMPPARTHVGFSSAEFDAEGRYVRCDFDRDCAALPKLAVISLYAPSGSSSPERQAAKFRFLDAFLPHLAALAAEHAATGREFVICGDWNIAHREIDLTNFRANSKHSGFLPEERAWLSRVFDELGWVDVYRRLHPDATGESYTWWSNRGQAWAKNVGWRIDYQVATPGLAARARRASIWKQTRFSDHAPLTVDYTLEP